MMYSSRHRSTHVKHALIVLTMAMVSGACAAPAPEREIVDSAAAALGGRDRLLAVKTLVVEGEGRQWNLGQDMTPDAAGQTFTVSFRRATDVSAGATRTEQTRTPNFNYFQGPAPQKRTFGVDAEMAYEIRPDGSAGRAPEPAARDRRLEIYHHPITIVRAALDPAARLGNPRTTGGERAVEVTTPGGLKFTLAIDGTTALPTRVVSMTNNAVLGDVALETSFAEYGDANGLKVPAKITTKVDNFTIADSRLKTTVDADAGQVTAPASLPKGAGIEEPPVNVTAEPVAIEFADHIAIVEAPSESRTLAVIAKARELRPGKPATRVINTHHHFDHSGGIRAAVSEGLTVVTHEGNAAFFKDLAGRSRTIAPDALTKNPKALNVEPVGDELVLKDAMREVHLYHIAGNPHSDTLLMAYLPRERLLIQADTFSPGSAVQPYAANLLDNVRKRNLRVERVVGVHGGVVPFAELVKAVQPAATNE
jgi:glyoxylase-like metal-dependent hydrolase (beta-lactamase superfamily II)